MKALDSIAWIVVSSMSALHLIGVSCKMKKIITENKRIRTIITRRVSMVIEGTVPQMKMSKAEFGVILTR